MKKYFPLFIILSFFILSCNVTDEKSPYLEIYSSDGELYCSSSDSNYISLRVNEEFKQIIDSSLFEQYDTLKVYTTLNSKIQKYAETSLKNQIDSINKLQKEDIENKVKHFEYADVDGGLISIDPASGAVLAWVGGIAVRLV